MDKRVVIRNVCMGLFFFLSGVEYAVILPTLNGYLISLNAKQSFLGMVMASFSLTGLLAAPVYGRITDRTKSTKLCVIIGNSFEIVGNFLYFISSNQYMVLGARLIAGIGSGVASSIFGMISRTTTPEERTAVFSVLMALRQIGLLVGPGFNVFLHALDFYIGPFHVDQYTSPGLLMVIIWLLHTLLLIFLYKDTEKQYNIDASSNSDPRENGCASKDDNIVTQDSVTNKKRTTSILENKQVRTFINEFLREEVIVCLTATFMVMFAQTGLETAAAPMTLIFFGWDGLKNSYLFCGAAFVVVASFFALSFASKRFSDRTLMLSGCMGMVATYFMYFTYTTVLYKQEFDKNENDSPSWLLPVFCCNTALLTISVPFIWVPQASLFSKVTSVETQAFNQGIRMVAMGLGQIIGPIWASSMTTISRMPIMMGVDLFLMLMLTAMSCLSYKKLVPIESPDKTNTSIAEIKDNERTPLLSGQENTGIN